MFVLEGLWDYEGGVVLGVYSSRELAEAAYVVLLAEAEADGVGRLFDDHSISEFVVDARAEF